MKIRPFLAACLALSLTAGCAGGPTYSHYQVQSRFVSSIQDQKGADVIATPAYNSLAPRATTVALRAPDRCISRTTEEATGSAATAEAILQTSCGVEMAEIERALTKAGYNVISWKVLQREIATTNSATDVADKLGAEVLFQINSLENAKKTLGQDARWERSYYRTNNRGANLTPVPLSEEARQLIQQRYLYPIEKDFNTRSLAVTLDATAVWVATGQSIWYYRWTRAREPDGVELGYDLRLMCMDGYGFGQCKTFAPQRPNQPGGTVYATGEAVAISASERPEDRERAIYAELYREVVSDLVANFAKIKSSRVFAPPVARQTTVAQEPAE